MEIGTIRREMVRAWQSEVSLPSVVVRTMGVGLFALMTILGAYIYLPLPFTPVPFTLQTFFVLLSGAFLGKRGGALSQGLYLLLGGIGLPIWAGGAAGLSRLWGPTGGYLLAFPLSAWVVGHLLEGNDPRGWSRIWGAMALGSLIIYGLGLVQLSLWLQCGLKKALVLGALPFLPGDLVKMILAGLLYRKGSRRWIPA